MNPFITSRSTLINIGWPRRLSIDTHGSRRAHLTRAFEEAVSLAIMNNCGLNCAECRLDHAVDLLREEAETLDDLREGLASAQRGEGIALKAAIDRMREKYDIPEEA